MVSPNALEAFVELAQVNLSSTVLVEPLEHFLDFCSLWASALNERRLPMNFLVNLLKPFLIQYKETKERSSK